MRLAFSFVVVAVACGGTSPTPAPPAAAATAIVDVTVVPMDREVELAHHTVIVRGGKIAALGPTATTPVPAGATVIDGRGKWLIPGLTDMHVHTHDPRSLAVFASMGDTTVRVAWGSPSAIGARDAIEAGEPRYAPSIYTAGPGIDGDPSYWPGSKSVGSPAAATAAVAMQARTGYDYIKVYSDLGAAEYAAIVAAAAQAKLPVFGHVPRPVKLGHVLAARQQSIEHLDGYALYAERDDSPIRDAKEPKVRMAAFRHSDEAKLADAVARTKAAGTWSVPTLIVNDRLANFDRPVAPRPEHALVPPALLASWDPKQDFRFTDFTADDFATLRAYQTWRGALVKRLADAGAGILAGTDVGNPWLVPGYSLHQELELLVAAKLTPYQALRAATANAGEYFATRDVGTVTTGARADLVLLDGDPLAQIANTQKIAGVMLRGRWFPTAELTAMRELIAADYRGQRPRFTDEPGERIFQSRFRATGDQSGEERVTVMRSADGLVVVGEQRLDEHTDARWELALGPTGIGQRMHVTYDGVDLVMTRTGVTGRYGHATIALAEAIASDEIFGGDPLGIDAAYQHTLVALAPGATTTLKLAVLDLYPDVAIEHVQLTVTRQPDSTRGTLPVRVFRVTLKGGKPTDIALDTDGWPVETASRKRI